MAFSSRTGFQRVFQQVNTGSATLAVVATIAAGTTAPAVATVAVPGAAIGDIVDVSSPAVQTAGLLCYGVVTAAGVVTIYFANVTTGTPSSAGGVYKVATYPFTSDVA